MRQLAAMREQGQSASEAPPASVPGTPPLLESDESDESSWPMAERWNAATAHALIAAVMRRVAYAWNATPRTQRSEAAFAALRPFDRGLCEAYAAADLGAVRRAVGAYESAAEPIFVAWRETQQPRQLVGSTHHASR